MGGPASAHHLACPTRTDRQRPHTTRRQIGKQKFANLYEYFQHKFGREDGQKFEAARRNLVRSLAAYAVVCFILQVWHRGGRVPFDTHVHTLWRLLLLLLTRLCVHHTHRSRTATTATSCTTIRGT